MPDGVSVDNKVYTEKPAGFCSLNKILQVMGQVNRKKATKRPCIAEGMQE
ncbi:hypothetical protein FACS1894137_08530 [Spirochaetia bacterium]|nr:hypothetical protein FACS1894137_08530 [Spirochaetia bacterium]